MESGRHAGTHAGEIETSILFRAAPELIREGYDEADHDGSQRPFLLVHGMAAYTDSRVVGFPSLATNEKEKAILETLRSSFSAHFEVLCD
ncbi:creatininase family protein [Streptomyces sp. NPDC020807]|uniref:creatininase family protein n=1 Tax=Streptomyces sp. NPDC020807 TaxID=3155119 RepID=UPI0033F51414